MIAHLRLVVAGQPPMPDMSHYPDYLEGAVAHIRNPKLLPDGILSPKRVLRQNVIDHDHWFMAHAVVVIEESASPQWDAHHLEIVRCHAGS